MSMHSCRLRRGLSIGDMAWTEGLARDGNVRVPIAWPSKRTCVESLNLNARSDLQLA